MAEHTSQEKVLALGKETTRGTETSALIVAVPCSPDTDFEYNPTWEEDEKIRGVKERFDPTKTGMEGAGSISGVPVEPETFGYFLHSLLGKDPNTTNPGTLAYEHTFVPDTGLEKQSYTFVYDRSVNKKGYLLTVLAGMSLSIPTAGKVVADFEAIFKEEAASALAIPAITVPNPFSNVHAGIYIADYGASKPGSPNGEIKEMTFDYSDGTLGKDTLNQSELVQDVVSPNPPEISGSFVIHFTDTAQRDDFVAGTKKAIWIELIGDEIETSYNYELEIILYRCIYKAYPYSDVDNILAAEVVFDAYYSVSDAKSLDIRLQNKVVSY